ncbi:hypothetical protein [Haliscomenobacter hydrossis]|uniref:hypothetical protein n=1 Tax=Haliscomenobacter hydrossis TaxID=2350 RepID=UPI00030C6709|nr:hypothetical protein [Haliscomenobacter hydrossis]
MADDAETAIGSDDPELEKNAGKKITWTNAASKTSIELSAYYDVVTQKHRVAAIFKAPYNPLVLPTKSDRSTSTAKFTVVNYLRKKQMAIGWISMAKRCITSI